MLFRNFMATTIMVLVCACAPPSPAPPKADSAAAHATNAETTVRAIYELGLSVFPDASEHARMQMTPELTALFDQAIAGADGDQVLDADPVFDANDPGTPEHLVVTQGAAQDGHVTVTARFTQNGEPTVIYYDLVGQGGHLLVDNIRSERGSNLRTNLQQALAEQHAGSKH